MVPRPRTRDVPDEASESMSPTSRVCLKSPRQALSSSLMKIFFYTELSDIVGNGCKNNTPLRSPCARSML